MHRTEFSQHRMCFLRSSFSFILSSFFVFCTAVASVPWPAGENLTISVAHFRMTQLFSPFFSFFLILVLALGSGSCGTDALAPEMAKVSSQETASDTVTLQLDLGNVGFNTRIPVNIPEDVQQEAAARRTRSALTVNSDGTTTLNLTQGNTKEIEVLLILRNADGSKVYVSTGNKWKINSDNKSVAATGKYIFRAVKGAVGIFNPDKYDEVRYLDAMTGGSWDEKTKAYIINKECKLPNHLYKSGESLELGKDIIVPFSLGTSSVGTSDANNLTHDRKWGVRMALVNNNRGNGEEKRLVCIDSDPDFRPYGSLLCMRFKNDMDKIENEGAFESDKFYNDHTWRTTTFSYLLRTISIESTSSTIGGWIQVSSLGTPDRLPLSWNGFRADGTAYRFDTHTDDPFFVNVKLDKADANNIRTGYPLFRKSNNESDSQWTPYFYVWMKSLDETKNKALYGSLGLNVRLGLYNATLDDPSGEGSRSAFSSLRMHKSGHAYFRDARLKGALMLPPLAYFGPNYVYTDDNGAKQWPKSSYTNSDMAVSRYQYSRIQNEYGKEFSVGVPVGDDLGSPLGTELRWVIPDKLTINSVFPPAMTNINVGSRLYNGKFNKQTQNIRVGNIEFKNVVSYYYRHWFYTWEQSTSPTNYNVYYALRNVGTPFCEAVRYTEYGDWVYNGPNALNHPSNGTKFVIHTRHLGDIGLDPNDEEACKRFLRDVISAGDPPPAGVAPTNKFWGDFWKPDISRGITVRSFFVPGSGANRPKFGPGGGGAENEKSYYVGRYLTMLVREPSKNPNELPNFSNYQIVAGGQGQSYEYTSPFTGSNAYWNRLGYGASVLPVLAPNQYGEPAWLDDLRRLQ